MKITEVLINFIRIEHIFLNHTIKQVVDITNIDI
jgi:hypothetical protein